MNSEIALNHNTMSRHVNDSLEVQQGYVIFSAGGGSERMTDPGRKLSFSMALKWDECIVIALTEKRTAQWGQRVRRIERKVKE